MASFRNSGQRRLGVCVILIAAASLFAIGLRDPDGISLEAQVRDALCHRLLANTTDGRQALVSSVWWAPLPTLLRLPLAALPGLPCLPVASLCVSIFFGLAALVLLNRTLQAWGVGWVRFLLAAGLAANPCFAHECLNGSSNTFLIFLVLWIVQGWTLWLTEHRMRGMVFLGLGCAMLLLSSAELAPWTLAVLVAFALIELRRGGAGGRREAVLFITLFPVVYALGLWMLTNWLIMNRWLYFARSLFTAGPQEGAMALPGFHAAGLLYLAAAPTLLLLIVAALRRDGAGIGIALLAMAPVAVAQLLAQRRYLWAGSPALLIILPLGILALGYVLRLWTRAGRPVRTAVALFPLLLAAATAVEPRATLRDGPGHPVPAQSTLQRLATLSDIGRFVRERSVYAKVFVCGYEGYALTDGAQNPLFVPSLDFNFPREKRNYAGQNLYLLVHRPAGRVAMNSIYWKYKNLFTEGAQNTLFCGDWNEWRLFEIVQGPRIQEAAWK